MSIQCRRRNVCCQFTQIQAQTSLVVCIDRFKIRMLLTVVSHKTRSPSREKLLVVLSCNVTLGIRQLISWLVLWVSCLDCRRLAWLGNHYADWRVKSKHVVSNSPSLLLTKQVKINCLFGRVDNGNDTSNVDHTIRSSISTSAWSFHIHSYTNNYIKPRTIVKKDNQSFY